MDSLGRSRQRLAGVLNSAFAEGLLSEQTHSYRLGLLFGPRLIDPHRDHGFGVAGAGCHLVVGEVDDAVVA
jgi:hypothetical protein